MNFFGKFVLISFLFLSCGKSDKVLKSKLYTGFFYDTVTGKKHFIICHEIKNLSNNDIYTFHPDITVNVDKVNSQNSVGLQNDSSNLNFLTKRFYYVDSQLVADNITYKRIPFENPIGGIIIQTYNKFEVDSFNTYLFKIRNIKIRSIDSIIESSMWLFLKKKTTVNIYYLIEVNTDIKKVTSIKVKTRYRDFGWFSKNKKTQLPKTFLDYNLYKDGISVDSLVIPVLH